MTETYRVTFTPEGDDLLMEMEKVEPKRAWLNDPIPEDAGLKHCWLRAHKHTWSDRYNRGWHRWKSCTDCGRRKMTHHVSCPVSCWGGPG